MPNLPPIKKPFDPVLNDPSGSYPLNKNPYDALQTLLSGQGGFKVGPTQLYDPSNNIKLYLMQKQREDELARNMEINPNAGATPGDLQRLREDIGDTESALGKPETDAYRQANIPAQLQGFGSPEEMAAAQRQAEELKTMAPVLAEQAKSQGALELEKQNYDRLMGLFNPSGSQPSQPTSGLPGLGGSQANTGQPRPNQPFTPPLPQPNQGPTPQSQGWWQFLTGKAPKGSTEVPYSSADDLAEAFGERMKYRVMPTPFAPLAQETSYANLQQLQAMFPGVRGFSYLLPLFKEHQASWGYETPAATFQRLDTLGRMLDETSGELSDPSIQFTVGAGGRIQMRQAPQMIERAKLGLEDTKIKVQNAMKYMEQLYPGIESILQSQGNVAPGSNKQYLDDNGNPR